MTTEERSVRAGRKATRPSRRTGRSGGARPVVAVTGATTGTGQRLVAELVLRDDVAKVIAIDSRRGRAEAATWRVVDVRDPVLVKRLGGVDVLVHLAWDPTVEGDPAARRAFNVRAAETAITAAAAVGLRRVVMLTSAMVYGALADNAVPLTEDAPIRAVGDDSIVGDLLEIEALVERARVTHPGLDVCVVRPATLVGPGVDSVLTRHFEAPRLLVVRESNPCWQFCHVDDLIAALVVAAITEVQGPLNVASDGWLEQSEVEAISGLRRIELPASVAYATAERLHRLGVTPAPASDLHYVVHPWVVSSERLKSAGWAPVFDNARAFQVLLESTTGRTAIGARRVGRGDAAAGLSAAGATVAVLGAAALVRRSRRRRLGG